MLAVFRTYQTSKSISTDVLKKGGKGAFFDIRSAGPPPSSPPLPPPTKQSVKEAALPKQQTPVRKKPVIRKRPGSVQWKLYGRGRISTLRRTSERKEVVDSHNSAVMLESVPKRLQQSMLNGFPLDCHPGPEGIFKRVYAKVLQSMAKYSASHKVLKATPSSRTLTWRCRSWCAGLGDRLRGITYSLLLAMFSKRRLIIFFDGMHEGKFLQPNLIDWRDEAAFQFLRNKVQKGAVGAYSDPYSFHVNILIAGQDGVAKYNIPASKMAKYLEIVGSKRSHVVISTNIMPSNLTHPSESGNQKWIASAAKWSGLSSLTDDEANDIVGLAIRYLFKVDNNLLEALQSARDILGLTGPYIALHVRTGFAGMAHSEHFHWKFQRKSTQWSADYERAMSAADRFLGNDSLIFLATDSNQVKDMAIKMYPQRFRSLDNELVHVDHLKKTAALGASENEGILVVWIELFLLAQANTLVMGGSGFPWLAGLLCGLPANRTITT